jgi:hypothetical protein
VKRTIILALLFLPSFLSEAQPISPGDTTVILSEYDALIAYPDFLTAGLAKIFVGNIKKAFIEDMDWVDADSVEKFSIRLLTDDRKIWLQVTSDTLNAESFTDLPLEPKKLMKANAVVFLAKLRLMFKDSTVFWTNGSFSFNDEDYFGTGYRNSGNVFGAYIEDGNGNQKISGIVTTKIKDNHTIYSYIFANLHKSGIKIEIFLRSVTITQKIKSP